MTINCPIINNLYYVTSSLASLTFTFKDLSNDKINILDNPSISKDYKDNLHKVCSKMDKKIKSSINNTVYYFDDKFGARYLGLGVFTNSEHKYTVVLGPYLTHNLNDMLVNNFIDDLKILTSEQENILVTVMLSLSSPQSNDTILVNIDSEHGYNNIFTDKDYEKDVDDIRQRYYLEKKFIQFISTGDEKAALHLLKKLNTLIKTKFYSKSLRSLKSLIFSFNVLSRKAIEENNIDYFCLHIISKRFEDKIEGSNTNEELIDIFYDIVIKYCDLVKNYNNNKYSKIVSNATNYIRLNSRNNMTLETISNELYVHKTYLAKKFKQETGKTTSQYINELRIQEAKFMLLNTACSIEYIGHHVGYNDIKYFSKIFKKLTHTSPREYRNYKKITSA